PEPCMSAGRSQINREYREPVEDRFHERRAPRSGAEIRGSVHAMQQLTCRDDGKEQLVGFATGDVFGDLKATPLVLDQDRGIYQDPHGSRASSCASSERALARSRANASASSGDRRGKDVSSAASSRPVTRRADPSGAGRARYRPTASRTIAESGRRRFRAPRASAPANSAG